MYIITQYRYRSNPICLSVCLSVSISMCVHVYRAIWGAVEYGTSPWLLSGRCNGFYTDLSALCSVGRAHCGHSDHHGGTVGVSAHPASSLVCFNFHISFRCHLNRGKHSLVSGTKSLHNFLASKILCKCMQLSRTRNLHWIELCSVCCKFLVQG